MKTISYLTISLATCVTVESFSPVSFVSGNCNKGFVKESYALLPLCATVETGAPTGFIDNELRGAAMKLHTRSQAPMEGEAKEAPREPYVTTMDDYLRFLVDSQHVYRVFEEIVRVPELSPEMAAFVDTGLERAGPLETDIEFIVKEYGTIRPPVGQIGAQYAAELKQLANSQDGVPKLICHYYNHYFAHTAGGRMIGKQMAMLLLDNKKLEFYKWDGDLKKMKTDVKNSIEELAASWSKEQKDLCVGQTAAAFQGGGMLNAYLMGGVNPH